MAGLVQKEPAAPAGHSERLDQVSNNRDGVERGKKIDVSRAEGWDWGPWLDADMRKPGELKQIRTSHHGDKHRLAVGTLALSVLQ